MISATDIVQGRAIKITIEDNGDYYAPQWVELKAGEINFEDFTALIGFENPLSAIKQIGRKVLELSKDLDKPIYFIGSTKKRTRVYAKMLKSCGFEFNFVHEPVDGDLAIDVLIK